MQTVFVRGAACLEQVELEQTKLAGVHGSINCTDVMRVCAHDIAVAEVAGDCGLIGNGLLPLQRSTLKDYRFDGHL